MVLRLGNIKPSRIPQSGVSPQLGAITGGAGIGQALVQLGQSFEGLAAKLKAREDETNRFNAIKGLTDLRNGLKDDIFEMNRVKELGAPGHVNNVEQLITESFNTYIEGVPEELVEEFTARSNTIGRVFLSEALVDQFDSEDLLSKTQFEVLLEKSLTKVHQDSGKFDVERAIVIELIESSSISTEDKAVALVRADIALRKALFSGRLENEFALGSGESVVAAPEIPIRGAGFLNILSGPESGNRYNVRNDGSPTGAIFNDFSKHPNVRVILPDGTPTTAAGRYQINWPTWQGIQKKLNLPDFSPKSQDRAAWFLAQQRYKSNTGRDLITDLRGADADTLRNIREVLIPTWPGLKVVGAEAFVSHFRAMAAAAELPDAINDPQFSEGPGAIPLEERERMAAEAERIGKARRTEAQRAYMGGISGSDFQNEIDFMRRKGEETPGSRFSDSRITEMFDPADAAELMAMRDRALSDGVVFNAVQSTTIEEDVEIRKAFKVVMQTPNGEAANKETSNTTNRLIRAKREALDKNPVDWVLGTNESILALFKAIGDADPENVEAATTIYDEAMRAEQIRLGVRSFNTRVLTDTQADTAVEEIVNSEFEAQGPLLRRRLAERGERGQQLLEELVDAGLSDLLFHAAIVDKASLWTRVASLLDPNNDPAKLLSSGQLGTIKEIVASNFSPYSAAFGAGDFLGEANERTASMLAVAERLVQQLVVNGMDEEKAARSVYKELITDQYNILEGGFFSGRVEALLPKAIKVDGEFVEINPDLVSIGAEFLLTTDRVDEPDALPAVETLNLVQIFFDGDATQNMEATRKEIMAEATWYLTVDSLGLVLMVPTSESSPTGDPVPVLRKLTEEEREEFPNSPGLPVIRSLVELQEMRVAPPSGLVRAVEDVRGRIEGAIEGIETPTLREISEGVASVPGSIRRDVKKLRKLLE